MAKGILIALEGLDGCGKTSQIKLLTAYLQAQGREVICTREPGGTRLGENLRQILLREENLNWSGQSEALVFAAARIQLLQEVILPALHKGQIVLSDRFYLSTLAYQGFGRGLDLAWLRALLRLILPSDLPLINLLLDLPPEKCHRLAPSDRLEKADLQKLVWIGYQKLSKQEKNCFWISGSGSPEEVNLRIIQFLQGVL